MKPAGRFSGRLGASTAMAAPGEVLFEITVRGNAARCAAIDVSTGVEVVVVGPPAAAEGQLKAVALRKLRMRLAATP